MGRIIRKYIKTGLVAYSSNTDMYALDNGISGPYSLNMSIFRSSPYVSLTVSGRGSFTGAAKTLKHYTLVLSHLLEVQETSY